MSRKHFIEIAEILAHSKHTMPRKAWLNLVCDFTTLCSTTNDNFDEAKFWDACDTAGNPFLLLNK